MSINIKVATISTRTFQINLCQKCILSKLSISETIFDCTVKYSMYNADLHNIHVAYTSTCHFIFFMT